MAKVYVLYDKKTELAVLVAGSPKEVATFTGCAVRSVHCATVPKRIKADGSGRLGGYEIRKIWLSDKDDAEEDTYGQKQKDQPKTAAGDQS